MGPGTRNWTEKGREEQKQKQFREKNPLPREDRESLAASGGSAPVRGLDVCHIAGAFELICVVCASCVLCSSTNSLVHHSLVSILNHFLPREVEFGTGKSPGHLQTLWNSSAADWWPDLMWGFPAFLYANCCRCLSYANLEPLLQAFWTSLSALFSCLLSAFFFFLKTWGWNIYEKNLCLPLYTCLSNML